MIFCQLSENPEIIINFVFLQFLSLIQQEKFKNSKLIVVPVHKNGSHWVLGVRPKLTCYWEVIEMRSEYFPLL